jgi:hypothetical protein
MNVYHWFTERFSNHSKALTLYKRGMARAKKHDRQGAIEDYTATIGMPNTPANVRAMALYNRALVLVATGDNQKGIDDLNAVLRMDESPVNVKTRARQKLTKMEARSRDRNA